MSSMSEKETTSKLCFLEDEECQYIMYLTPSKHDQKGYELCKICQLFKLRREVLRLRGSGGIPNL